MTDQLDFIQRMTLKKDYPDFKEKLEEHSRNAFKYGSFQDYIIAAERKLGRRLVTHEIEFLFKNASTSKGKPYRWDFSIGHPRGRYVHERPMHNIYTKVAISGMSPLDGGILDVPNDSPNVFVREEPKQRPPRFDKRKDKKPNPSDADLNKDKYRENRDLYDTATGSDINSNSFFLQKNKVAKLPDYEVHIGGSSMGKVLNSSVGEVKDLLSTVKDRPLVRVAISRLVRQGY